MSIKSTIRITRPAAIERIKEVAECVQEKNYVRLERLCFESGDGLQAFVDEGLEFNPADIEKWTNNMLEDRLDEPFFRRSMFENYIVINE